MNWLSIVVLIFLAICIKSGFCKGFFRTISGILSIIISIVLVSMFNPQISDFIKENTPIYREIKKASYEKLEPVITEKLEEGMDDAVVNEIIEELPLPSYMIELLDRASKQQGVANKAAESLAEFASAYVAQMILNGISFMITLIMISIIIHILFSALDAVFSIPVLSTLNRLAGALAGAVQAVMILWIVFLVISLCFQTEWGKAAVEMLQENPLTKVIYDTNLWMKIIGIKNL